MTSLHTSSPAPPADDRAPRVSVLLPVFDEEPSRLRQAAESILTQTFADLELLLLDDGSTRAETRAALAGLASADARTRLLPCPRMGLARVLNVGIAAARGEYIARQDSDDWSDRDRIARQVALLEARADLDVAGTQALLHRADGTALWPTRLAEHPPEVAEALSRGANPFFHGSTCFRTAVARAAGGYRAEFCGAEDLDLFWRLAGGGRGANLGQVLYHYRFTPGSISSERAIEQSAVHAAVVRRQQSRGQGESLSQETAGAERERRRAVRLGRLRQADRLLLAGSTAAAWRVYGREILRAPAEALAWAKAARAAAFLLYPPAGAKLWAAGGRGGRQG